MLGRIMAISNKIQQFGDKEIHFHTPPQYIKCQQEHDHCDSELNEILCIAELLGDLKDAVREWNWSLTLPRNVIEDLIEKYA